MSTLPPLCCFPEIAHVPSPSQNQCLWGAAPQALVWVPLVDRVLLTRVPSSPSGRWALTRWPRPRYLLEEGGCEGSLAIRGREDGHQREYASWRCVCTAEAPFLTSRANPSEEGRRQRTCWPPAFRNRLHTCSSQALFSPAAPGHKVQWGDFVISSQGSLKGPAPSLGVNRSPIGCECAQQWVGEVVTEGLGRHLQGRRVAPLNTSSQGLPPLLAGPCVSLRADSPGNL